MGYYQATSRDDLGSNNMMHHLKAVVLSVFNDFRAKPKMGSLILPFVTQISIEIDFVHKADVPLARLLGRKLQPLSGSDMRGGQSPKPQTIFDAKPRAPRLKVEPSKPCRALGTLRLLMALRFKLKARRFISHKGQPEHWQLKPIMINPKFGGRKFLLTFCKAKSFSISFRRLNRRSTAKNLVLSAVNLKVQEKDAIGSYFRVRGWQHCAQYLINKLRPISFLMFVLQSQYEGRRGLYASAIDSVINFQRNRVNSWRLRQRMDTARSVLGLAAQATCAMAFRFKLGIIHIKETLERLGKGQSTKAPTALARVRSNKVIKIGSIL